MHALDDIKRGFNDLRSSLESDVFPAIQVNKDRSEGGYFIIPREFFSYINFLGLLYKGPEGNPDPKFLSRGWMAVAYIEEIVGEVDETYRRYGKLMYEMYRHGTAHVYRPNLLENRSGQRISFMVYKGSREGLLERSEVGRIEVRHGEPIKIKENEWWLPLSIDKLYEDLLSSLDVFERKIKEDPSLIVNWSRAIEELSKPTPTDLTW